MNPLVEWHHKWGAAAEAEGWCIFGTGPTGGGPYCLEKDHDSNIFAGDKHAWFHVWKQAKAGSEMHDATLVWIEQHAPEEYIVIEREVQRHNEAIASGMLGVKL